jgi:hypothetical protein
MPISLLLIPVAHQFSLAQNGAVIELVYAARAMEIRHATALNDSATPPSD